MFTMSRQARDYSLGSTDSEEQWLLPISPISFIHIGITGTYSGAANQDYNLLLAAMLTSVQVRYRGTSIISMAGADLARLVKAMGIFTPRMYGPLNSNGAARSLGLVIPFGRKLYDPNECFPNTAKGELELFISWDASNSSYGSLSLDISTAELPNAKPAQFLRYTTMSDTPSSTGVKDYDLPRLAPLLGLGIFASNTYPASGTPTLNSIKMLVNNQDYGYTDLDPTVGRDLNAINKSRSIADEMIAVTGNLDATYTQFAESGTGLPQTGIDNQYVYLDYDPARDGAHLIPGPGSSEVKVRLDYGAANAVRLHPVEWYKPSNLPGRSS